MILLRNLQTSLNHINISLRGPDAAGRLLLERMQHIHNVKEADCIDRTVGVAVTILHHLEDTRPLPFQGLADGCVPPNCATPSAFPISSFTASGK